MQTHSHSHKGNAKAKAVKLTDIDTRGTDAPPELSVLERLEALLDTMKAQATHNAPITPDMIHTIEEIVAYGRDHDKRDE